MDLVANADRLTGIFGRWPSFHDAEVTRLMLDRSGPDGPVLEVEIHLWELTSATNAKGFYITRNHTLAALRFWGIDHLELSGFNGMCCPNLSSNAGSTPENMGIIPSPWSCTARR